MREQPLGASGSSTNDFSKRGYGGPCRHRARIDIFSGSSRSIALDLKAGARRSELDAAMRGHLIAQGELMECCIHR